MTKKKAADAPPVRHWRVSIVGDAAVVESRAMRTVRKGDAWRSYSALVPYKPWSGTYNYPEAQTRAAAITAAHEYAKRDAAVAKRDLDDALRERDMIEARIAGRKNAHVYALRNLDAISGLATKGEDK